MSTPSEGMQPTRDPNTGAIPIDPSAPEPPAHLVAGSAQLQPLAGKRLLVGLTYVDPSGTELSRIQFCGRVITVEDGVVVVANPEGEQPVILPADVEAYSEAPAGAYTLQNTGDIVVDPDFMTTWRIVVDDNEAPQMNPVTAQ